MLKSAGLLVMLVAAPAFAQEGARTDVAAVKKLLAQAAGLVKREPADLALAVAQVDLSSEIERALHASSGTRLKVAPR
jgi:hypothetical protein